MSNYPLTARNKDGTLLYPSRTYYSDEYAESMCNLFLRDCIERDECGKTHKYFRLHAKQAHSIDMALAYDIHCPDCNNGMLKQFRGSLNYHELGLYRCPLCDKK